jgi:hypothetical protein
MNGSLPPGENSEKGEYICSESREKKIVAVLGKLMLKEAALTSQSD